VVETLQATHSRRANAATQTWAFAARTGRCGARLRNETVAFLLERC